MANCLSAIGIKLALAVQWADATRKLSRFAAV